MDPISFVFLGSYAVFISVWFVVQQKLFSLGAPRSLVSAASGLPTIVLVLISLGVGIPLPAPEFWLWLMGLVVCNVLIAFCLLGAVKATGAAVGANAMGLAPVFGIGFGWRLLGEVPGWAALTGIIVTFAGVYVFHLDLKNLRRAWRPFLAMWEKHWIGYTLGVALGAGIGMVLAKRCVELAGPLFTPGLNLFLAWGVVWAAAAVWTGEHRKLGWLAKDKAWLLVLVIAVSFSLANWAESVLYYYTQAAAAGALKRVFMPLTVVLSWLVFTSSQKDPEKDTRVLIAGSSVIFAGAVLIAFD